MLDRKGIRGYNNLRWCVQKTSSPISQGMEQIPWISAITLTWWLRSSRLSDRWHYPIDPNEKTYQVDLLAAFILLAANNTGVDERKSYCNLCCTWPLLIKHTSKYHLKTLKGKRIFSPSVIFGMSHGQGQRCPDGVIFELCLLSMCSFTSQLPRQYLIAERFCGSHLWTFLWCSRNA